MKDFIKFTLASCLGVFLAFSVFFVIIAIVIGGLVAAAGGGDAKSAIVKGSVLTLDFTQPIPEQTNNVMSTPFSLEEYDIPGLHDIAGLIRHAATDEKISGILIENGHATLGSSSASVILEALQEFKASDKFLAAYGDFFTQEGYYLASPADHITVHPVGTVDFRGYASAVPFFKGLLDKIGLDVQIYYAGNFKSATEPFRRQDMSPENKLQTREFLNETYDMYLGDIATSRNLNLDSLRRMAWEFRIRNAEDALAYRLVDEIGAKADCEAWMNEQMGKPHTDKIAYTTIEDYSRANPLHDTNYKVKDKIAVIYAEGEIVSGRDEYGVIDDGRYVKLLKDIRRQEDIKAVVLRINSPGGNILSAENIYRQLKGLQADGKKLVVSMGDYAASGGYYLSAMADTIYAEPNTLTGSIGVFSILPNPSRALKDKLGVTFDTVRTGPYSADFTLMFPWTEREHKYLQDRTEAYYELFLNKVGEGRDMTRDQVHSVAQGRIWSGKKAKELGLVDELGTLKDAIETAANLAGLKEYRIREYPTFQNPLEKLIAEIMDQDHAAMAAVAKSELPQMLRMWEVMQSGEPQARLPYGLEISR